MVGADSSVAASALSFLARAASAICLSLAEAESEMVFDDESLVGRATDEDIFKISGSDSCWIGAAGFAFLPLDGAIVLVVTLGWAGVLGFVVDRFFVFGFAGLVGAVD